MAFLNPLEPYSPIFLPGFDKEEYAHRPPKEDEEEADGGAKVAEAKAEKEPKAEAMATRVEVNSQDNNTHSTPHPDM